MKSEEEISTRVRDLLVAELAARIKEAANKRPTSCKHNHRHPLDERRTVEGDPNPTYNQIAVAASLNRTLGLCMYGSNDPTEWSANICEDDVDAMRCPYFDPVRSEVDVVTAFQARIKDPAWLTTNLPAIAELRWVLDGQLEAGSVLGGEALMEASLEVHPTETERITMLVEAHLAHNTGKLTAAINQDANITVLSEPFVGPGFKGCSPLSATTIKMWLVRVWRAIWGLDGSGRS